MKRFLPPRPLPAVFVPSTPHTPHCRLGCHTAPCPQPRRNYQHLPVTSVTLPVDPSGRYEGFPHFVAFAERIKFVGGINKPKIVSVADSEGRQHRQLVSGWVGLGVGGGGGGGGGAGCGGVVVR